MAETSTSIQATDSLSANEFRVEINGAVASGIFGVSGLHSRKVDLEGGKLINQPVLITKMVQRDPDMPFNAWIRETLANPATKIARQLAVVAMDEGVETRRWVLKDAWISAVGYSDFDSGSDQLIEERITVQHSGVEEVW